jgi:hypothetical protein
MGATEGVPLYQINLYDVLVHKGKRLEVMSEPQLSAGGKEWSFKVWEVDTNDQDKWLRLPADSRVTVEDG